MNKENLKIVFIRLNDIIKISIEAPIHGRSIA
jgi:hypothetical protein